LFENDGYRRRSYCSLLLPVNFVAVLYLPCVCSVLCLAVVRHQILSTMYWRVSSWTLQADGVLARHETRRFARGGRRYLSAAPAAENASIQNNNNNDGVGASGREGQVFSPRGHYYYYRSRERERVRCACLERHDPT
jgi:hypothetical protein